MRSVALLTTSLGILLHTLLGWCPQHVGCAGGATVVPKACGQQHHRCKGHHHAAHADRSASTTEHGQIPLDSESHSCDHADCLVVSHAESVQALAPLTVGEFLPQCIVEHACADKLSDRRENTDRFFLPHVLGQAARIARGVWLI